MKPVILLPFTKVIRNQHASKNTRIMSTCKAIPTTAVGRDALLRFIQYSLRLYLTLLNSRLRKSSTVFATVSVISAIRRVSSLLQLSHSFVGTTIRWNALRLRELDRDKLDKRCAHSDRAYSSRSGLEVCRESLDSIAVISDAVFLFARLQLLPLPRRAVVRIDKLATVATLVSSAIGLLQIAQSEREIYAEGRLIRKGMVSLEEELERNNEFWETDDYVTEDNAAEREGKVKLKVSRRKLRSLRSELDGLWYERIRLAADGVFSLVDVLEMRSQLARSCSGIVSAGVQLLQAYQSC